MLSFSLVIQRGMHVTPLGFCLRVIVNEKPVNLEKMISSVLSSVLLLIYGFQKKVLKRSFIIFFLEKNIPKCDKSKLQQIQF